MPHSVIVVEDQAMPRQLFASFVEASAEFTLAKAFDTADSAVAYCEEHDVDLVLMDVVMRQGMSGLEAAERIKAEKPNAKIIIVTSMPEVSWMERARSIGVEGFWYKEVQDEPILAVMNRVMAGESVYPDAPPELVLGEAASTDLTAAELKVLREMTTGATDHEIAEALGLSVATVRTHIQHMLRKTGYKNRVELAVRARVEGLVIGQ